MAIDHFSRAQATDSTERVSFDDAKTKLSSSVSLKDMQDFQKAKYGSVQPNDTALKHLPEIVDTKERASHVVPHEITNAWQLREQSLEIFKKIDRDGDEVLSRSELARASRNPEFKGQHQQAIAGLNAAKDFLPELSKDQWGGETGISKVDLDSLQTFEDQRKQFGYQQPVQQTFENSNRFAVIDQDQNGFLSKNEIDARLKSRRIDWTERSALRNMRENYDSMMNNSNDEWFAENNGISRADLNVQFATIQKQGRDVQGIETAIKTARAEHDRQHVNEVTYIE